MIAADLHSKKTIHETASGHDIGASDGGPTLTCSIQAEKNMKICLLSHDNKGSLPRFPVEGGVFFTLFRAIKSSLDISIVKGFCLIERDIFLRGVMIDNRGS